MLQPTLKPDSTHRGWVPERHDYRCSICWPICSIWHRQWTIDFSSGNYMTLQKTAHYVESFKICCQVEDYMLSWTTTAVDGETRRTACPRVVYYLQYCLTYTQTTRHFTMEPGNFVNADDLCVTKVEHTIEEALDDLPIYYRSKSLRDTTENIPNTPMQHGYKTQHSTVTALHTLNNTIAKGFNQMAPPERTITVALDMSKAFDIINIHTLIRKLLQTNLPGIIIKFFAN